MDLPFKPHFAIVCSCGEGCTSERSLTSAELAAAEKDFVVALRMLPPDEQRAAVAFYTKHKDLGHTPEPRLMGLAPLPVA